MVAEKDVVLIYLEDQPFAFARIEAISADHKVGWYQVKMLLLQIPLQTITWILRDAYINGDEFTMSGQRLRLESVRCPADNGETRTNNTHENDLPESRGKGRVIDIRSLHKP